MTTNTKLLWLRQWAAFALAVILAGCSAATISPALPPVPPREDLFSATLPGGSQLRLAAVVESLDRPGEAMEDVAAACLPAGVPLGLKGPTIWGVHLGPFTYRPEHLEYFALVRQLDDHVIIALPWNGTYAKIQLTDGRIVERGPADDALRQHDQWIPLKLIITVPQSVAPRPRPTTRFINTSSAFR